MELEDVITVVIINLNKIRGFTIIIAIMMVHQQVRDIEAVAEEVHTHLQVNIFKNKNFFGFVY